MEKKFILAADSGCDLSADYCKEIGVKTIFIKYGSGEEFFPDNMVDAETKVFYEKMRAGAHFKTSQINYEEYYAFFEELVSGGTPVVYLALSSGISGSYGNSARAANDINEKLGKKLIFAVDTAMASAGMGMLVVKAAEFRDGGMTAEECAGWMEANKKTANTYYTTSTLTYLVRGGRVSKVSGFLGNMLGINPILDMDNPGALRVCGKCIGKKAAYKKIIGNIAERVVEPEKQTLFVSHADAIDEAKAFGEEIKAKIGFKDIFYTYIGTTIGAHTGPGLRAIFFFGKERS